MGAAACLHPLSLSARCYGLQKLRELLIAGPAGLRSRVMVFQASLKAKFVGACPQALFSSVFLSVAFLSTLILLFARGEGRKYLVHLARPWLLLASLGAGGPLQ